MLKVWVEVDSEEGERDEVWLMVEREDYDDFLVQYGALSKHGRHLDCVLVELITTPGKLLDATAEFLGWEEL